MKTACVIFSFDRPHYLEKTLDSIINSYSICQSYLKNNNIQIDFYFMQDGLKIKGKKRGSELGVNKSTKIINAYKNQIKTESFVYINTENKGIAKQKYKANEMYKKYDNIIFFEDDMIVSPYYFQILFALNKRFPNCSVTACDRTGGIPKTNLNDHLHKAIKSWCHLWGYLMPSNVIEKIQPTLSEYIKIIGNDYKRRPNDIIRKKYKINDTSHDAVIHKTMKNKNLEQIATYVPRAKYIGENGMHANTNWFNKYRFNVEKQYIFSEDSEIGTFELINH